MNTSRTASSVGLTLVLAWASGAASAHDYWLEPVAGTDGAAALRLFVGECLKPEEEKRYEGRRSTRFEALSADGTTDLAALAKNDAQPILSLPASDAQRLVVLDRNASYIELDAKKFDAYLHEEGLDDVRAARKAAGESDKPGRERYTRYLKTLLPGMAGDEPVANQTVGQTLELIPMEDPGALVPGERLHVRVLFETRALVGAKVELCTRGADGKVRMLSATTDTYGDVAWNLPAAGLTLVRTVHMQRVTDGDEKAEWQSSWGSYSFVVRAK